MTLIIVTGLVFTIAIANLRLSTHTNIHASLFNLEALTDEMGTREPIYTEMKILLHGSLAVIPAKSYSYSSLMAACTGILKFRKGIIF
jgi:hypothetical protein